MLRDGTSFFSRISRLRSQTGGWSKNQFRDRFSGPGNRRDAERVGGAGQKKGAHQRAHEQKKFRDRFSGPGNRRDAEAVGGAGQRKGGRQRAPEPKQFPNRSRGAG